MHAAIAPLYSTRYAGVKGFIQFEGQIDGKFAFKSGISAGCTLVRQLPAPSLRTAFPILHLEIMA